MTLPSSQMILATVAPVHNDVAEFEVILVSSRQHDRIRTFGSSARNARLKLAVEASFRERASIGEQSTGIYSRAMPKCACHSEPRRITPHYRWRCSVSRRFRDSFKASINGVSVGESYPSLAFPFLSATTFPTVSLLWYSGTSK